MGTISAGGFLKEFPIWISIQFKKLGTVAMLETANSKTS